MSVPTVDELEFCCTVAAKPEMIDYNGHLNVGYYAVLFEEGARAIFSRLDLSRAYRERTGRALFAAETHVSFQREVFEGEVLDIYFRSVDMTDRALHVMFIMINRTRGMLAAVQETVFLHVDLASRRVTPLDPETVERFSALKTRHEASPPPVQPGRRIELRRSAP